MASPSDKEKTNHTRLSRLLTDIGRRALQDFFDKLHPPSSLHGFLNSSSIQAQLNRLKSRKVIFTQQWDKLYPPSGAAVSSSNFDITLLFLLLRNVCGLPPPPTGWDAAPSSADLTTEADLVRIKRCRNELYAHRVEMALSDIEFNANWAEIEAALVRLGGTKYQADIKHLQYASVDPEKEKYFHTLLSQSWEEGQGAVRKLEKDLLSRGSRILVVLVIVTAVLYQLYYPGSTYRYSVCRRGSIAGHEMWFTFLTFDGQTPRVHGIEFEWQDIKKKLDLDCDEHGGTDMHYYLNLDRCAYGGVVTVKSMLDGTPQVRGAEMFAVDSTCSRAYYNSNGGWHVYISGKKFKCVPPLK